MKTEKFDDAFKRKFDSLDETSAYSEEEIDKAQHYVNSRMQKTFFVFGLVRGGRRRRSGAEAAAPHP